MKTHHLLLLTVMAFSSQLFAADNQNYDPSTARAYEAYLLTFVWPDKDSSEQVDYQQILSSTSLPRYAEPAVGDSTSSAANIAQLSVPFDSFKAKIAPHAQVLVNKKWTLIFKNRGDSLNETFHSSKLINGYPELTGQIAIKYGRYLESNIQYKHYLFKALPSLQNDTSTANSLESQQQNEQVQNEQAAIKPTLVLNIEQKNKTASKKLNYIDHPIIGTLIYFEPIDLEDAIQQVALEKLTPTYGDAQIIPDQAGELTPNNNIEPQATSSQQ